MNIEIAARQLESIGSPTRLQIYRLLVRAGTAGLAVGSLQHRMAMAASTLSHHLKRLVSTGLVSQERVATRLICRAEYPAMRSLIGFLTEECCADEMAIQDQTGVSRRGSSANALIDPQNAQGKCR
ncbi:MAG: metalloregulator ArsR/SmtB family transcription factor [Paracoccaceae bacterium]|nr:metalloregulator ArsR/SmtB family transcription factor [Paracoccaceae bacterium]